MEQSVELVDGVVLLPPVGEEGVRGRRSRFVHPLLKAENITICLVP